jgi:hypothetical protein
VKSGAASGKAARAFHNRNDRFIWVDAAAALAGRPPYSQFAYWPWCSLIIASILALTALRLNDAGSCMGG